ncbi:CIC11C00000000477 [Sungouiella intermedia]|uniref:CIC11C00000000477 n=1 Tax=Sungouiella intermedia TaxID=45354 RepID=A0A1L0BU90_9ASCO|nr:CIC11C00000000477 [[Candida] intermedia]
MRGLGLQAAIDQEKISQAYLADLVYMYSNQIGILRAALANRGITLQELTIAMAQVQVEYVRRQKLEHKIQRQLRVNSIIAQCEKEATSAAKALTKSPDKSIEKVLSSLYKKESRMLKKLKQIS